MMTTITYHNIPVDITPNEERPFQYQLFENEHDGQYYKISSDGKELYINEDLAYLKGDMPIEWREPAIAKLLILLRAKEYPDGP